MKVSLDRNDTFDDYWGSYGERVEGKEGGISDMCPFEVGDFVRHKLDSVTKMFVCAVRKEDDLPMGQVVMRIAAEMFPIGCRLWNEEKMTFELKWFTVEELEPWTEE